ncbi:MAG: deoxyhypusine synthase family protein [Candidatus Thermoplasmatota archaeon]|nr:deoxyhypusine synthase family protein [Candidatus Thermoplasmatota archaeon]
MVEPSREDLLKIPIEMIDLSGKVSIDELVTAFSRTSFQARKLAQCTEIFRKMTEKDGTHTVMLGMSGALIAGGLRKVISDMIKMGLIDVIVTTGAVIYQDLYQAMGYDHYRGDVNSDDVLLHSYMIDRIHDTYVDEDRFRELDVEIGRIMDSLEPRKYSTREFMEILGARCTSDSDSILGAALERGVPIYCPAVADSSIGIGLSTAYKRHREEGKDTLFHLDTVRDNFEIAQIVHRSPATGAIYLGGGVPKNYINDSIVMADMLYGDQEGHEYAFQITMDRADWGGLSGSTLSEARSWGKIGAEATYSMVHVELSIALPLIAGAVMEGRNWRKRKGASLRWNEDELISV